MSDESIERSSSDLANRHGWSAKQVLDTIATLAFIVVCGVVTWKYIGGDTPAIAKGGRKPAPVPSQPVKLDWDSIKGPSNASATLIVFSDFECPFCGQFAREVMPTLDSTYVATGRLRVVFSHFPLAMHSHALLASEAAECTAADGLFWQMHDRLFEDQKNLDQPSLLAAARSVGVKDMGAFQTCLTTHAQNSRVRQQLDAAVKLQLASTPTLMLGMTTGDGGVKVSQLFTGVQAIEILKPAIDALLSSRR